MLTVVVVGHRLTHAHKHHVTQPLLAVGVPRALDLLIVHLGKNSGSKEWVKMGKEHVYIYIGQKDK